MKYIIITLIFFVAFEFASKGQPANGIYVGFEQNPFCYKDDCIKIHDTSNIPIREGWFQKVTFTIADTGIIIEKIPIYFPKSTDSIPHYDSTAFGGYYYYSAKESNYFPNRIDGYLLYCKYCYNCGSATCRYTRISYSYKRRGLNLLMDAITEKNILFELQQ